jgi:hypothetical protein
VFTADAPLSATVAPDDVALMLEVDDSVPVFVAIICALPLGADSVIVPPALVAVRATVLVAFAVIVAAATDTPDDAASCTEPEAASNATLPLCALTVTPLAPITLAVRDDAARTSPVACTVAAFEEAERAIDPDETTPETHEPLPVNAPAELNETDPAEAVMACLARMSTLLAPCRVTEPPVEASAREPLEAAISTLAATD